MGVILYISGQDKVIDNKIHIMPHIVGTSNTYWHFKNRDVVFPNWFGFDIHNYIDDQLEYMTIKDLIYRCITDDHCVRRLVIVVDDILQKDTAYNVTLNTSLYNISGVTKIDNDAKIYYFVHKDKVGGIRIGDNFFGFHTVYIDVQSFIDKVTICYYKDCMPNYIKFKASMFDGVIDIEDYKTCMMALYDEYKEDYSNLLLGRI